MVHFGIYTVKLLRLNIQPIVKNSINWLNIQPIWLNTQSIGLKIKLIWLKIQPIWLNSQPKIPFNHNNFTVQYKIFLAGKNVLKNSSLLQLRHMDRNIQHDLDLPSLSSHQ